MNNPLYPFWATLSACVLAQLIKPFVYYLRTKQWRARMILDSGNFPSSHSALVSALVLSVGLRERFSSTIFAVSLVLAMIVLYDAANVRFYAGRNIQVTKQLVNDFKSLTDGALDNPLYSAKMKEELGHQWLEILGGIVLGIGCALLLYWLL